jgi:hypothetical protein
MVMIDARFVMRDDFMRLGWLSRTVAPVLHTLDGPSIFRSFLRLHHGDRFDALRRWAPSTIPAKATTSTIITPILKRWRTNTEKHWDQRSH